MRCGISAVGMMSALGAGAEETVQLLFEGARPQGEPWELVGGRGAVLTLPVAQTLKPIPPALQIYDCRNNRLAMAAYSQIADAVEAAVARHGAHRVGVVVGSSTSGLDATENKLLQTGVRRDQVAEYSFEHQHHMGSLSAFVAAVSGAQGPVYTVSTACSSSAKAILSARGLIKLGVCDCVITGGIDSLCHLTVNGFFALGQVSDARTNPMSRNRNGLNIGEGGALMLLDKDAGDVCVAGGGESMDAYHMSAPHPQGLGAKLAIERALQDAGVRAADIAYVNLHGTGTKANDHMEALAVHALMPNVVMSSTKTFTGHCLGASGAIEAAICYLSLRDEKHRLPPHLWDGESDPSLPDCKLVQKDDVYVGNNGGKDICFVSNSFAFGGNNCSLVFTKRGGE